MRTSRPPDDEPLGGRSLGEQLEPRTLAARTDRQIDAVMARLASRRPRRARFVLVALAGLTSTAALAAAFVLRPTSVRRPPSNDTSVRAAKISSPWRAASGPLGASPSLADSEAERSTDLSPATVLPNMQLVAASWSDAFVDSVGVGVAFGAADTPYADTSAALALLRDLGVRHVTDYVEDGAVDEVPALIASGCRVLAIVNPNVDVARVERRLGPALFALTSRAAVPAVSPTDAAWGPRVVALATDFRARVSGAGLSRRVPIVAGNFGLEWSETIGDLSAAVDVGRLHYGLDGDPPGHPKSGAALQVARRVFGDKPLVAASLGYSTARHTFGVTEAVQAKYVPRLLLTAFAAGVKRTYLRHLLDIWAPEGLVGGHFGIVRHDGTKKPAFEAVKDLVAWAADPGPAWHPAAFPIAVPPAASPVRHTLLGKRDGSYLLALWLEVRSEDADVAESVTLSFGVPVRSVVLRSPGLQQAPQAITPGPDGTATISVRDRVSLLEIVPAAAP